MFDVLPESAAPRAPRAWGSRVISLALHAAVIAAAVRLTEGQAQPPDRDTLRDTTVFITRDHTARPPAPPPPGQSVVAPGPVRLVVPVVLDLPNELPPIGDSVPALALAGWDSSGVFSSDSASRLAGTVLGAAPIDARLADEAPRLLDHPPLRYPEVMRQAGVEGRVVVEAVLDTSGRVEPGSLRTAVGVHQLFDAAARDVVAASRYRPARLAGRAVRVRILVPVAFALQR
jgi:TonB family protein